MPSMKYQSVYWSVFVFLVVNSGRQPKRFATPMQFLKPGFFFPWVVPKEFGFGNCLEKEKNSGIS